MKRFAKYRELVTLARRLEAEAAKMSGRGQGYWDRISEADEYRAKAEHMAGRIDADEYNSRLCEAGDVRANPID
jgi:hypothetical protein